MDAAVIADFLCKLTDGSQRPESVLKNTSAALACLCDGLGVANPLAQPVLHHLKAALIKSGTTAPMRRSKAMPTQPFIDLFHSWPANEYLQTCHLRSKCLALLALVCMLRPSDVAPNAELFVPDASATTVYQFTVDDIVFHQDNMVVTFVGTKNDQHRQGFPVTVPRSSDLSVCPVAALQTYIARTNQFRSLDKRHVFLSLKTPYDGIKVKTIARILKDVISAAGLEGYTAKDFRPTGATAAVQAGMHDAAVMRVGRWKSVDVFRHHYVHYQTPSDFTDKVLGTQDTP